MPRFRLAADVLLAFSLCVRYNQTTVFSPWGNLRKRKQASGFSIVRHGRIENAGAFLRGRQAAREGDNNEQSNKK